MITQPTIDKLHAEQRGGCAWCGRLFTPSNPAQCHHAIYGRDVKFAKWLDLPANLILLCAGCHSNHGDMTSWFMRCHWWTWKMELGYDMEEWEKSIPMVIHDNFLDLRRD